MYIILRWICEILSRIAVKISFLWGCKHGVYAIASFTASVTSWYLPNGLQNFTSFILFILTSYISLGDYAVPILKFYIVPVR